MAASLSAFAQAADNAAAGDQAKKQEETTFVLNKFTVTGSFAGSLEAAANEKKKSAALVEVIAPEDIGKLPDVSIADALDRLTGLTSQRVNGRAQQITIRGFSPDFSTGTLDGVEQATTNDNRAVEFDQYPSELLGGVVVAKTGQANTIGGLAGNVDLQTVSPLNLGHRIVALKATQNWTSLGQLTPGVNKTGHSFSVSYIDQFDGGKEGIYLGYAHTENPTSGQQYGSWGYSGVASNTYNAQWGSVVSSSDPNQIVGGMKFYDYQELLKRDSFVAVLESRPNENIHSKVDVFYSKFNDKQLLDGLQMGVLPDWADWRVAGGANSTPQIQPGFTSANGVVTSFTLKNVLPVTQDLVTGWDTKMESVVWNLDLAEKSEWPVHLQTGYSQATRKEEVLEDYVTLGSFGTTATGAPGPTWVITNNGGPHGIPNITASGVDFTNGGLFHAADMLGWGQGTFPASGQEGYLKYFSEKDIADSIKLFTKHDVNLGFFKDVEAGVGYTQRYKWAAQSPTGYLVNTNGQALGPAPSFIGVTNLSWMGSGLNQVAWDANAHALQSGNIKFIQNPNTDYLGDNYTVWENIMRPYAQFDLKGDIGGLPVEGNIGLVSNLTQQKSKGFSGATNMQLVSPVSSSVTYGDVQPSLNLIFKPTDQDLIRLFVGRQEQRPRMYDIRASRNFSFNAQNAGATTLNQSPWGGNAGNPNLRPWVSNSIDLDFEHYFAHGNGYFSLALFEKNLLSYIYQKQSVVDFTGYAYTGSVRPTLWQGVVSQVQNGQGGKVSGAEATLQVNSELLTGGAVRGFGLVLNGIIVNSSIQPWGPGNGTAQLPDMSKKAANLTFYWERYGFSARVNAHYQSAAREYIITFGAPSPSSAESPSDGFTMETAFHTIDAQVSYTFSSGPVKGLGLYLEGRNLNKAPLVTLNNGNPLQVMNYQTYGAFYSFGATYKF